MLVQFRIFFSLYRKYIDCPLFHNFLDFLKKKGTPTSNKNVEDTRVHHESQYLDDTYNSEVSDIMNEIMGISGSSCKFQIIWISDVFLKSVKIIL